MADKILLLNNITIAIVGLGYVGLPLAVEFGKLYNTLGLDLSANKIESYQNYNDPAGEVSREELQSATKLTFHTDPTVLKVADIIIIAVPTPIKEGNQPDFIHLISSSEAVGCNIKHGATVVYESTVYPGATEEVCIPILEKYSGLKWKKDFWVGYSPERINPGDKERTISKIVKVVSGDTQTTLDILSSMYGSIIKAGVYKAKSIKVAEAAKVIENTQRDLNIALMNELAMIFHRMGIETRDVLDAATTKWNFLPFNPGLVGGHCIGVDPYYLTHKAEMLGYHPQIILAGRRINDGMPLYIAQQTVKKMIINGTNIKSAKVIVLGLTFKENCSDIRNSKVADLVNELKGFGCDVYVNDPLAKPELAMTEYGIKLINYKDLPQNADAIIAAVSHHYYKKIGISKLMKHLNPMGVFIDVKSVYSKEELKKNYHSYWNL